MQPYALVPVSWHVHPAADMPAADHPQLGNLKGSRGQRLPASGRAAASSSSSSFETDPFNVFGSVVAASPFTWFTPPPTWLLHPHHQAVDDAGTQLLSTVTQVCVHHLAPAGRQAGSHQLKAQQQAPQQQPPSAPAQQQACAGMRQALRTARSESAAGAQAAGPAHTVLRWRPGF